jgi:hypothetical protein
VKPLKIWVMIETSFLILISRNSSRMMPDTKSRNSGIFLAEIPEFRDLGKNGISGNPEIPELQPLVDNFCVWFVWLGNSNARMRQITCYHAAIAGEKYGGGGNRL